MEKNIFTKQIPFFFLAVTCLLMISASVYSQDVISRDVVVPIQAGSVVISQGKAVVVLSKETLAELNEKANSPSYYVVITSVDNNLQFGVADKNDRSFTIQPSTYQNNQVDGARVDFVVFIKATIQKRAPGSSVSPQLLGKPQK